MERSRQDTGATGCSPTLLASLVAHATAYPGKPAFVFPDESGFAVQSYADLVADIATCAGLLRQPASGQGSGIVLMILKHTPVMFSAYLGAMGAGLIPSFLPFPTPKQNPDYYWHELKTLVMMERPCCILTYRELAPSVSAAVGDIQVLLIEDLEARCRAAGGERREPESLGIDLRRPQDTALLQHSSGTTGLRKGVMLSFEAVARQSEALAMACELGPKAVVATWLPMYHDMGLFSSFLIPLHVGATVVTIDPFDWLRTPESLFAAIASFRATHCWLPNFAFIHLANTVKPGCGHDLSSMAAFVSCSEPSKPAAIDLFVDRFAPLGVTPEKMHVSYAMAEASFAVTQTPLRHAPRFMAVDADALATRSVVRPAAGGQTVVFTSCGPLVDGVELRIDATGSADEPGIAAGEVMLRGGFLFQGYYNQPALTADVITDGWFRTGDIGFVADGELFICGRSKDILIVHGRNYYAHDIEAVASAVPGVIAGRVVAIGQYTETTGSEELVLIAETRMSPADAALLKRALKQAVVETLGLLPRVVKLVPPSWLVKTTSGKISRKANLERFEHESLEPEASHAG